MKIIGNYHPVLPDGHKFKVYASNNGLIYICQDCDTELSNDLITWKFYHEKEYRVEKMPKSCAEAKMLGALE